MGFPLKAASNRASLDVLSQLNNETFNKADARHGVKLVQSNRPGEGGNVNLRRAVNFSQYYKNTNKGQSYIKNNLLEYPSMHRSVSSTNRHSGSNTVFGSICAVGRKFANDITSALVYSVVGTRNFIGMAVTYFHKPSFRKEPDFDLSKMIIVSRQKVPKEYSEAAVENVGSQKKISSTPVYTPRPQPLTSKDLFQDLIQSIKEKEPEEERLVMIPSGTLPKVFYTPEEQAVAALYGVQLSEN